MAWNEAALATARHPADRTDGAGLIANTERWLGRGLPAAVAEWFRTGANRRLAQLNDNH